MQPAFTGGSQPCPAGHGCGSPCGNGPRRVGGSAALAASMQPKSLRGSSGERSDRLCWHLQPHRFVMIVATGCLGTKIASNYVAIILNHFQTLRCGTQTQTSPEKRCKAGEHLRQHFGAFKDVCAARLADSSSKVRRAALSAVSALIGWAEEELEIALVKQLVPSLFQVWMTAPRHLLCLHLCLCVPRPARSIYSQFTPEAV